LGGKSQRNVANFVQTRFSGSNKINSYTIGGKQDEYDHTIPETLLKEMMNSLVDFCEEETLLQYHGRLLGLIVGRTPKCHPEIAGEGIEYDWATTKLCYPVQLI